MYQLFKLNYLYQDLEPYLNTHTIGIHYLKHTKGYLDKLNALLEKNKYTNKVSMEDLFYHLDSFSIRDREDILFNLGGVLNHFLYFNCLSKQRVIPSGSLLKELIKKYGSYDNFYTELKEKALQLKGSGYVFLEISSSGELIITTRINQDSPYFYGNIPLFCIDMWEHAYYLDYENNKFLYLDNLASIVNFSYASQVYEKYISANRFLIN